jgi:hypothetical protein
VIVGPVALEFQRLISRFPLWAAPIAARREVTVTLRRRERSFVQSVSAARII